MDAGWKIDRCIVCLREPQPDDPRSRLTKAHVIPRSIGGKLWARFLCEECNGRSGTAIEADLVNDPTVRHLVEQLICVDTHAGMRVASQDPCRALMDPLKSSFVTY